MVRNIKRHINFQLGLLLLSLPAFSEDRLVLHLAAGCAEIQFESLKDWQYTVECSEDLRTWDPLAKELFGTGSRIVFTNQLEALKKCFYRIKRSDEFTFSFNPSCFDLGNEWVRSVTEEYYGELSDHIMVERVERYSQKNGYDVFELSTYEDGSWTGTEYMMQDISEGLFSIGSNDPDDGEIFYDSPEPFIFNRFIPGVQSDPFVEPSTGPDYGPETWVVTTSIDYEPVGVPAGLFQNTVKVEKQITGIYYSLEYEYSLNYTVVMISWYAKDVGLVKDYQSINFDGYGTVLSFSSELTLFIH